MEKNSVYSFPTITAVLETYKTDEKHAVWFNLLSLVNQTIVATVLKSYVVKAESSSAKSSSKRKKKQKKRS